LLVIEDAAQAVDSYYQPKPLLTSPKGRNCSPPSGELEEALGSIGHLSAFSFHETKNIISGEGGMLAINDDRFVYRAEIIWEKGTNRAEFFRGEVNKYGWVDTGSSFLPSEIVAAFLWAQIEYLDDIQAKRKQIWNTYFEGLKPLSDKGFFHLPEMPEYTTNNAHMFYLVCNSLEERTKLIAHLKANGILAVFHYLSLHSSDFYKDKHDGRELKNCDKFADCLIRLPLFYEFEENDVNKILFTIKEWTEN
jgi:dTDP-4-amino-4,6-dideoxygalactose transaminase